MRLKTLAFTAGSAVAICTVLACSKSKAQKPAGPVANGPIQGTVLETLPAPPYAYLRLKTAQGEIWAAVQAAEVKVGSPVTVNVQMKMAKFESPSLHRTFDPLYMGTLAGAAAAAPGAMAAPGSPMPPSAPDEKVAKAAGEGAHTVAELYGQKAGLKDKSVLIKGKVVKYNEGIMGKNWLHLRDGSGAQQSHDNDITVTTKDTAKLGDVVTVKGPVHLDKDFGLGYAYPVIIEDAKIVK